MFDEAINSKKRGDIGVGYAIAWASSKGFTVSIPLSDSQDYDLVIDDGSKLIRVQVKTVSCKRNGYYVVNLRVMGGNRSGSGKNKTINPEKVDLIFILTMDGDMYAIPTHDEMPRSNMLLGKKYESYKIEFNPPPLGRL